MRRIVAGHPVSTTGISADYLNSLARTILEIAIKQPQSPLHSAKLLDVATHLDHYLRTHPDTTPLTSLLTFMANLISPPTFDQPAVFRGKDAFMDATYPLIRFPVMINLIDESSVTHAISTIQIAEGGNRLLQELDDIFEINRPEKTSKYISAGTDSSGWKLRVMDQYGKVKQQAILYIATQLNTPNIPDLSAWVNRLGAKLSEMVACETNLFHEYSRLQMDIAQDLSADDLPFDLRVQCRLATMVLEPKLLSVHNEIFRNESIARDYHLLYYSQQLVFQELAGIQLPQDKYGLSDSLLAVASLPIFRERVVNAVKSGMAYSEIVSVISQDYEGLSAYFGKHLHELPAIQTQYPQVGCVPGEDGTTLSEDQWQKLVPSAIFHTLLHSKTIAFRLPPPQPDIRNQVVTAMTHCSLEDLTTLTGLSRMDFYNYVAAQGNVPDAVMASGCNWLAQEHIARGGMTAIILNDTVMGLMGHIRVTDTYRNHRVAWSHLGQTDLDACLKATRLLTTFCKFIDEQNVFSHTMHLCGAAISSRNKEKLILQYVSGLLDNRSDWSTFIANILKAQRDRSIRVLNGGSNFQEFLRLCAPLISVIKVAGIILLAWIANYLLSNPTKTGAPPTNDLN